METIRRKSLLYKSGLGFTCINPVQGCAHGCLHPCYAFSMAKHYGRARDYADWLRPKLVENAPELLARELGRRQRPSSVHLCLTTDPFMCGYPEVTALSLELIALLNAHGVEASVLSKGVLPAELADTHCFGCDNTYGISLVSLDEGFRARFEPHAAPYADRIRALRRLHDAGRCTLVHIEPYPTPNIIAQELPLLLDAVSFVDHIYFSGWNYNALVREHPDPAGFYREQGCLVRRFCEAHEIDGQA